MPKKITKEQLQQRFDSKFKMSRVQLEELFPEYNISEDQMRFLEKGIRNILVFDIEATGFDARMGFIICWWGLKVDILTGKTEMVYDNVEKEDMQYGYKTKNFDFDKRILSTLSNELRSADMVTGHYITKYDLPFFEARCYLTRQEELVPEYMEKIFVFDTWRATKQKLNLYNSGGNSLRNAGYVVAGYDGKTSVDLNIWKTMFYASHPKWNKYRKYINEHCEIDVYQNYDVFKKLIKRMPIGGGRI